MTANARPLYILLGLNLLLVAVTLFMLFQVSTTLGRVRSDISDLQDAAPANLETQLDQLVREVDAICGVVTENTVVPCY